MGELIHRIRSEPYRAPCEVGNGLRPMSSDIFRLARAYPDLTSGMHTFLRPSYGSRPSKP